MVAGMSHVPIIVVILGAIPFGVAMSPAMIAVTLIVIAIAIADGDATKVDADDGARGCGVRECGGQDDQRRGQNGPFEQFHAGLPFRRSPWAQQRNSPQYRSDNRGALCCYLKR